jgi:hypothetical protein
MKKEKIGVLIYGKKLNSSKVEIIDAARILNKTAFKVSLFGKSKSKVKSVASQSHLQYVNLGKKLSRNDFSASLRFTKLLKDKGISTILFRDHRSTGLLVTTKFLLKGKLRLIFIQDRHLSEMKPDFLHTFRFNQIDAWITPMNQTAHTVKGATHLALDKIHIMPLPIPRKPFQFEEEERKLRKSILFGNSESIVIGWNVPESGAYVQRTGNMLVKLLRSADVKLCINVKNSDAQNLYDAFPELAAFTSVTKITPFDPHDADLYAHLDVIFIDPEIEPFSGITRRALMAGVLPVAPKSLVADELLENGEKGMIYSEQDCGKALAEKINPSFLARFREKTQGQIGEKYTKKRFKENLEALIHSLPKKAKAH